MSRKRTLLVISSIVAVALTIYVSMYFVMSSATQEFIQGPDHTWTTREFKQDWHVKFFKPLWKLEDVIRDGDFSVNVNRAG